MKLRTAVLVGMVLLAALTRLLPHPPNFTALGALALFAGARFPNRWTAFLVPLAALFVSDAALQVVTDLGWESGWLARGTGFYGGMWVVYAATALVTAVGLLLRQRRSVRAVACGVAGGSTLFFLVTNFAWWTGYDLYPHTLAGLLQSYVAALPFYGWSLAGDATYATLLFGGLALAERLHPALRPSNRVGELPVKVRLAS
jgi:hypothetical protein